MYDTYSKEDLGSCASKFNLITHDTLLLLWSRKQRSTDAMQELKESFQVFDKNGDGFISTEELRQVMISVGKWIK